MVDIAKSPPTLLPLLDVFVCSFGIGMVESMLEPHLCEAGADITQVGITFLIFGGVYMVSSPFVGYVSHFLAITTIAKYKSFICLFQVCDKYPYQTAVTIVGNTFLGSAFLFIGPMPPLIFTPTWISITIATCLGSIGYAAVMVSTYGRTQKAAELQNFTQDIDTFIMVSGAWLSSFFLGNFVGSTLTGFLVDAYGFSKATILVFTLVIVALTLDVMELILRSKKNQMNLHEYYHIFK